RDVCGLNAKPRSGFAGAWIFHQGGGGEISRLATDALGRQNRRGMWQLCKEFLLFLRQEKKWWLIPLIILLLILGALILFSSSSVLAPLMYPFM
ncbi:MAG TPA: DUF5989 family protein, partial [Candidatus Dormibacteraeota bacterium]|nr:DUF5989 family protein [Candidatus Dormibacteraeota bacterium]